MNARAPRVRIATSEDRSALAAIYGHHVLHGTGTFEELPPASDEMERRRAAIEAMDLPYLLAEGDDGAALGFAYAGPFRMRRAYRFSVEDSVYVAPSAVGRGVGRALLAELLLRCEALGVRQVVAVIGDSDNAASIGLHRALGFVHQGVGKSLGWKHGRWLDVVWMQRSLGAGDAEAPTHEGLRFDER